MKILFSKYVSRVKWSVAMLALFFSASSAQVPQNIPTENTPTDWSSWPNILLFVVLPVAIVLYYLFFRRKPRGPEEDI